MDPEPPVPPTRPHPTESTLRAAPPSFAAADLAEGTLLDQFRILRALGRGGMGAVYEAEDTLLRRRVAIKIVPRTTGDDRHIAALLREARGAAQLDHPNVVRIHHIGRWDGGHYLVLELVEGGSLHDRLRDERPLPWKWATRAVMDACQGLAAAHAAGMVHRDVKPANLLLDRASRAVKVTDFGLVRGGMLSATESGQVVGTPYYMSPEQCRGEPADARSDLYALGATYYHLLTGRPPFERPTAVLVLFAHCTQPPPDPRELVPDLPEACATVVLRAMAKDPADRFPDARAMLAALAVAKDASPPVPTQRAVPPPLPRRDNRHRRQLAVVLCSVAVSGILILALLVSTGFLYRGREPLGTSRSNETGESGGKNPQRAGASGSRVEPTVTGDGRIIRVGGNIRTVTVSKDGKLLAAGGDEPAHGAGIWNLETGDLVKQLDWGRVYSLVLTDGILGPFLFGGTETGPRTWIIASQSDGGFVADWMPDWSVVRAVACKEDRARAFGCATSNLQGRVEQYSWTGPSLPPIVHASGAAVHQIAYAPSEDLIAVAYANGDVWVQQIADEKSGGMHREGGEPPTAPTIAFAPDRSELAVGNHRVVRLLHPAPWQESGRMLLPTEVHAVAYSPNGRYLAVAGADGMVALWEAEPPRPGEQQNPAHLFRGHEKDVLAVTWTPDGRTLVTGGGDGTVRLWPVPPQLRPEGGKP